MAKETGELTHFDASGAAHMVDVGAKDVTSRLARATCSVHMKPETLALITSGTAKKGDVLGVARLAGIMAAKKTSELIPLCHPLPLTSVSVDFDLHDDPSSVTITSEVAVSGRTGVEMEALTAASVAALTVYDMCKSADKTMKIKNLCLLYKSGGASGTFEAAR
ncbi:MAG: cyclic pyranopterin monophosphate synthase MoaC [Pseudomonadota bacterium]